MPAGGRVQSGEIEPLIRGHFVAGSTAVDICRQQMIALEADVKAGMRSGDA